MADKSLIMGFMNETGKKVSITVPGIKDAVTEAEVSSVMDTIIAKNIFNTTGGDLKLKDSAEVVDKTVSILTV